MKDNFKEGEVVVIIFHDHGTRYLGKMFNNEWMLSKGFFDKKGLTAKDLVSSQKGKLISLNVKDSIGDAVKIMSENDFSQVTRCATHF